MKVYQLDTLSQSDVTSASSMKVHKQNETFPLCSLEGLMNSRSIKFSNTRTNEFLCYPTQGGKFFFKYFIN